MKDDLIYKYNPSNDAVYFSTKSLVAMDAGCSAADGPVGAIIKVKGKFSDDEYYASHTNSKQFDGFFVDFSGPQATCALNEKNVNKVNDYANQLMSKIYWDKACVDAIK